MHGKSKCSRTNCVKKNSWQFAFNISLLCHVFDFLFENLPLSNNYNVFSSCFSIYSPSLALFNFDTDDLFCVKYQETRNVSLLRYETPTSLLKNEHDIRVFFLTNLNVFWDRLVSIYTDTVWFETNLEYLKRKSKMKLGLIYRLHCFNFDTDVLF